MAATIVKISSAASVLLGRRLRRFRGDQSLTSRFLTCTRRVRHEDGTTRMHWYAADATLGDDSKLAAAADSANVDDDTIAGPPDDLVQSLSTDEQKTLKILWMEVEVFRQSGFEVPKAFRDEDWLELLALKTHSQRRKYCRFLMIREFRKENEKKQREESKKLREEAATLARQEPLEGVIEYGLNRNTIFHRIHDSTMNVAYNHWACQAILFGQSIVFDLDYDEYMRTSDCQNCADQLQMAYGYNKIHREQFYMHFCNANPAGRTMRFLERSIPNLKNDTCLINITSNSYLDVFPKERLVYLTPHCTGVLRDYDHDDVYIVGGLVDRAIQKPLSMAKAKKEGLRMAKLPLDDYLLWGSAGKSLTIEQMLKIMLDFKNSGSWDVAFKNVPRRKIKQIDEAEMERIMNSNRSSRRPKWTIFNDNDDESKHIPTAKLLK